MFLQGQAAQQTMACLLVVVAEAVLDTRDPLVLAEAAAVGAATAAVEHIPSRAQGRPSWAKGSHRPALGHSPACPAFSVEVTAVHIVAAKTLEATDGMVQQSAKRSLVIRMDSVRQISLGSMRQIPEIR